MSDCVNCVRSFYGGTHENAFGRVKVLGRAGGAVKRSSLGDLVTSDLLVVSPPPPSSVYSTLNLLHMGVVH